MGGPLAACAARYAWRMSRLAMPSDPPPGPPVLEYGNSSVQPPPPPPSSTVRLVFFAVSLVAAVTPFLPFTFHTSPLDVWTELLSDPSTPDREVVQIATPFFVALPMAVWGLRRVI